MLLSKLELGQVWKAKDDEITIINEPLACGFVRYQLKTSGWIGATSLELFRRETQCLLGKIETKNEAIDIRSVKAGMILQSSDRRRFIVLPKILRRLVAVDVETGEISKLGEVKDPTVLGIPKRHYFESSIVVSMGRMFRVMDYDNNSITVRDEEGERKVDWKLTGCLDEADFGGNFEDYEMILAGTLPSPGYGSNLFMESYMREIDAKLAWELHGVEMN